MKIAHLIIQLLTNTYRLAVLLVHQDPQLAYDCKHKVLANPPPELGVEDGSVLRVGQHHQTVVGELLVDQGLVAFTDVKLVNISLDQGLKSLWAEERVCLGQVKASREHGCCGCCCCGGGGVCGGCH